MEKKWPYPKCSNCGIMVIGSGRVCGRCGQSFTDEEIMKARADAGKCPGCGCSPCRCMEVKQALEDDPDCRLVLIEGWKKRMPRPDSMVIPGNLLDKPGGDVHLSTTNRRFL